MALTGFEHENSQRLAHGQALLTLGAYLVSGSFLSAVFENWESEFLQMSAYVMLTAILFQRGSAESVDPDDPNVPAILLPTLQARGLSAGSMRTVWGWHWQSSSPCRWCSTG